jgi:hypothetical protein
VTIEILSATPTPQNLARIIEVRVGQARRARPPESIPETAIFGALAVLGFVQERLSMGRPDRADRITARRCLRAPSVTMEGREARPACGDGRSRRT